MNTLAQDAQAAWDAYGTAIYYAKRMDDHEAVQQLVLLRRRIERQFAGLAWNRAMIRKLDEVRS